MIIEIKDIITCASLAFSLFAFIYSLRTSTKKYELKSSLRKDILDWYYNTTEIMINLLRNAGKSINESKYDKNALMTKLSSQIELGRFYFPNIDKGDDFGSTKPSAYQGYRNLVLDLLVFYYRLFDRTDYNKHLKHAITLQRHYTSIIFDILDPNKHLIETEKITRQIFTKTLTFEDFIDKEPEIIQEYI